MAIAPQRIGIGIRRHFTTAGVHPYDEVDWERRDARITNYRDGTVAFEQLDVEVPATWSLNATNILAQKYFRGPRAPPSASRSLKQVADRVVDTITDWGIKDGYFADDEEAETFRDELKHLIIHQKAAFNSPVWFNIGVAGVPQQGSACFILSVEDSMDSILNWYTEEGMIFKGGSGAGINLSRIRSSHELPEGRRHRVGPGQLHARRRRLGGHHQVGWQDPAGGQDGHPRRRSPRHRGLHLVQGDRGAQGPGPARRRVRHGPRRQGLHRLQYQNANNSVRVTDEFMEAVVDGRDWDLDRRATARSCGSVPARDLFRQIADAAWECADPGMQFDTTINRWHTAPNTGRING